MEGPCCVQAARNGVFSGHPDFSEHALGHHQSYAEDVSSISKFGANTVPPSNEFHNFPILVGSDGMCVLLYQILIICFLIHAVFGK